MSFFPLETQEITYLFIFLHLKGSWIASNNVNSLTKHILFLLERR